MKFNRNEYFDFENRIGRVYWSQGAEASTKPELLYDGVHAYWDSELANADGAHYHVWIERSLDAEEKLTHLRNCLRACRNMGDVVRFSYDYIPEKEL